MENAQTGTVGADTNNEHHANFCMTLQSNNCTYSNIKHCTHKLVQVHQYVNYSEVWQKGRRLYETNTDRRQAITMSRVSGIPVVSKVRTETTGHANFLMHVHPAQSTRKYV